MSTDPANRPVNDPESIAVEEHERIRGCLLAAACGDALSAPFEGVFFVPGDAVAAWEQQEAVLGYTDDTALMLALADHLATATNQPEWDIYEDGLAWAFARTWEADPRRGYGAGAVCVLQSILNGVSWQEAAGSAFGGTGSYGNGGAMRVAPVGLLPLPMNRVSALARRSAALTHAHEHALDAAAIQACAVAYAHRSPRAQPLDGHHLLATVAPTPSSRSSVPNSPGWAPWSATATPRSRSPTSSAMMSPPWPRSRRRWPPSCTPPTTSSRSPASRSAPAGTPTPSPPWPGHWPGPATARQVSRSPGWPGSNTATASSRPPRISSDHWADPDLALADAPGRVYRGRPSTPRLPLVPLPSPRSRA